MDWNLEPEKKPFGSPMIPAKKQLIVFLTGWLGFQVIATLVQVFLVNSFSIATDIIPELVVRQALVKMLINTLAYFVLLILLLLITYTDIAKQLKSFKQWQSYLAGVVCLLSIYAFNFVYGNLINLIPMPVTDNVNEAAVVSLQSLYPVLSLVLFGFVAPICEELTYRTGLFSLLKRRSRALAYGVTIVVFALIHSNFTITNFFNELLNLPYYAYAAFAFCFTYERYGFAGSVTAHILNNVISCVLTIIG